MRRALAAAMLAAAVGVAVAAAPASAAELDGASGPAPLASIELSGTWSFTPSGQSPTTIAVPGGGWYKQGFTSVGEAVYSRTITVPDVEPGEGVELFFGAVNNQATLSVDGHVVGTQTTAFMPQLWDITKFVQPGGTYRIDVDVKGRQAMTSSARAGGLGGPPATGEGYLAKQVIVPDAAGWQAAIPQGIFRSAKLLITSPVSISDAYIRTSVAARTLTYDVTLANHGAAARTVTLGGRLSSWNRAAWPYPSIPQVSVTVPAGAGKTVTVGPLAWPAPPASYWWPNVPYRHGYRAQLHELRLSVDGRAAGDWRFGFREFDQAGTRYELNGVPVDLRGDSMQGAMYDGIDYGGGQGDAYDTLAGFLPPAAGNPGWPRAVDHYERLNYDFIRIHQEPATPYMLDVLDRMGLMVMDESAIRGSESNQDFVTGRQYMIDHVRDLVRRDRDHPAVIRWSQSNEPDADSTDSLDFEQALYHAAMGADATRPVSIDVTSNSYDTIAYPNFSTYQHYVNDNGSIAAGYTDDVHPRTDRPFGRGEFIWPMDPTYQGFAWFATATEKMREKDASDIRPYALAGAWASVIPGVRSHDFLTDSYVMYPLYGEDNLPHPWANPQIQRVQKAFNPVLVADSDYWQAQKYSDPAGRWPSQPVSIALGQPTTRHLVAFNDTFAGTEVDVRWEARSDAPDGAPIASGELPLAIPLGGHVTKDIAFTAPSVPGQVYLVLTASKPGEGVLFHDADEVLTVGPVASPVVALPSL